jgi:hypothetical protein
MSVNIVNQTTGDLTQVAGNATDKVGNLSAATTTDKSSVVAMVNELNSAAFSGSFSDLSNKPSINSVELSGNKTTSDLGINADNVMMSDGVTSVEDALDDVANRLITPSGTYSLLGYDAINGSNPVLVSLGNNNIFDYDFLWMGVSYYNSGVATYGYVLVPVCLMHMLFSGDAGVGMVSRDNTNTGVTPIAVAYDSTNNAIRFDPEGTPAGAYYYVLGVKIRTIS